MDAGDDSSDETLDLGADADGVTPVLNFDSPSSRGNENDGDPNGFGSFQNTMHYDETLPLEIEDFMLETEAYRNVTRLGEDTQVVDDADFNLDGCNNNVAVDTDSQGTDHTEVVLSDDDYQSVIKDFENQKTERNESGGSLLLSCLDGQKSKEFPAASSVVPHSFSSNSPEKASGSSQGCTKRSFTAVRSASLRQSGLAAARSLTSKSNNTESSNTLSTSQVRQLELCKTPPLGFNVTKRDDEVDNMKDLHFTGSAVGKSGSPEDNANANCKDKVKSARARKLFVEDTQVDIRGQSMTDRTFGGLSYVDSQEPGESSQQMALNIVDKLICVNDVESSPEAEPFRISTKQEKSPHTSILKGRLSLAQQANPGSPVGKAEIYDWVDSREDEGGGDFFSKRKDVLLGNGESILKAKSEPRRRRYLIQKTGVVGGKFSKNENCGTNVHQKILGLFHSDSRSLLQRSRKMDNQFLETELKKNITKEVDKQLIKEPVKDTKSSHATHAVGFDTQLAAEAMEVLGCESPTEHDERNTFGAPDTRQMKRRARIKQVSKKSASSFSDTEAKTRKSKQLKIPHTTSYSTRSRSSKVKKNIAKEVDEQLIEEPSKDTTSSHGIHDVGFDTQLAAEAIEALGCAPETGQKKKGARLKQVSKIGASSSLDDTEAKTRKSERLKTPHATSRLTRSKSTAKKPVAGKGVKASEREQIRNLPEVVYEKKTGDLLNQSSNENTNLCINSLRSEGHATPVVYRTRQSIRLTSGQGLSDLSNGIGQAKADLMLGSIPKKRRSIAVPNDEHMMPDAQKKCLKLDPCQNELPRRNKRCKMNNRDTDGQEGIKCHKSEVTYDASSCHNGKGGLEGTAEKVDEDKDTYVGSLKDKLQTKDAVSPVCYGDNSPKLLGKHGSSKSLIMRELLRLDTSELLPASALQNVRKRRDMSSVRVLLSNHLGDDVIRQQKKIMARLGVRAASCASDATHFVADEFVRTRNMLEAMALGKLVVTHLWLQSCGQARCFIDEKDFILRDHKKEKEIGFSMRYSLARASQYPLLQGKRVLITPNAKPNKELLAGLVKAVQGQPVERLGRSAMKNDKVPDDLLIISCEEDYTYCVSLLEKGAEIYSSELLLNGIVIQTLEYQRHRIFVDHVKKTRSTIWLRNGSGSQFRPVARNL